MAEINNTDDSAIVKDSDLLNEPTRAVPAPDEKTRAESDTEWVKKIVNAGLNGQLDMTSLESFTNVAQNREDLYRLLDSMATDPTIAAMLETYSEDATESNDAGKIVWAESSDDGTAKYVNFLLDSLQIDKNIYKYARNLCLYGDLYLKLFRQSEVKDDEIFETKDSNLTKTLNEDIQNEDIQKDLKESVKINIPQKNDPYIHYIEMMPNPAEMFELTKYGKTCGYIKADVHSSISQNYNSAQALTNTYWKYKFKRSDVNVYQSDQFVHATLDDNISRTPEEVSIFRDDKAGTDNETTYTVKRGQSLFYDVFKIWRELSLLENSMLLNRITKSAIIRVISVEVGDMPKEDVGPHLQGIKSLMEQKSAINAGTSIQEYTNPGPIENNIYVPTYNQKGAITASQIGGDVNIGQLPDIEYFQNKFFGAMRAPKQYFGLTDDGAGFNGGQSLAIISSRYAKMVKRIQNALRQAITDIINILLVDKGMDSSINKFTIKMQAPTTQEEIDRRDNKRENVGITGDIMNMISDIDSPAIKLKILKALLSNVITDSEVIGFIQDEIDKLEESEEEGEGSTGGKTQPSPSSSRAPINPRDREPLDLDAELDIETTEQSETPTEQGEEETTETLPTPEELGKDFTDFSEE